MNIKLRVTAVFLAGMLTLLNLVYPVVSEPNSVTAFSTINIKRHYKKASTRFTAVASWYGPGFHGKRTANGEVFDQNELTAAHKTLPFNTKLKVTNVLNNKTVIVKINDRGPYVKGRDLDLSKGAAKRLGMIEKGVVPVKIQILN